MHKEQGRSKVRAMWAALAVSASLLLSACAGGDSPGGNALSPVPDGKVTWAIAGANLENGHMDPHKSQLDTSAMVGRLSLDSLTYLNADGELKPWLATSWSASDSGDAVTFELRNDVTFSDGTAFNAEAVKANFDHIMAPETASTAANSLLGGDLYKETTVDDEYTVTVHFEKPYAPFLNQSSSALLGMYSPATLKENAQKLATGGPGITVGSGPWVMTDYQPGVSITYERNDDYKWLPEGVTAADDQAKTLEVRIIGEDDVRVQAAQSGEAHIVSEVAADQIPNADGLNIEKRDTPGIAYSVFLNQKNGHLSDQKVREAMLLSADISGNVDTVFGGELGRAWSIFTPTTPGVTGSLLDDRTKENTARAERLLDEAGWTQSEPGATREKDGEPLKLDWISWTPRSAEAQTLTDLMVADWQALGIEVENRVLEPGQYQELYDAGTYDMADWDYSGVDPDVLRNHLHSGGYQNATHLSDPAVDEQLDQAASETDAEARNRIYDQLQNENFEQIWAIPLYNPVRISMLADDVRGVGFDGAGHPVFFAVEELAAE